MSLNIELLERARLVGRKLVARCPACAEEGRDRKGDHLVVMDGGEGPYRCIVDGDGAGGSHSRRIFALAGHKGDAFKSFACRTVARVQAEPDAMPTLPALHKLTADHIEAFGQARRWNCYGGLGEGARRGFLHYCEVWDRWELAPTLLITDSSRRNVEMRRLDGSPWRDIGKKVKTLPGVQGGWPIGAADIGDRPVVGLCEGGPDFCALMLFALVEGIDASSVAPVFMTGASKTIPPMAARFFRGKRVRIFVHNDRDGASAGKRWSEQLWEFGATLVDGFSFEGLQLPDGKQVKDLAEYATTVALDDTPCTRVFRNL